MGTHLRPKKYSSPQFSAHVVTKCMMGQDASWYGGRPLAWPHCVSWGPAPPRGTAPSQFLAVCCGQTARWIKMPLGAEVGLGPGHIMLDGDPAPPKNGHSPYFSHHVYCGKRLDGSRCHLVRYCGRSRSSPHCVGWCPSLPPERGTAALPSFQPLSSVPKRLPISATAELLYLLLRGQFGFPEDSEDNLGKTAGIDVGTFVGCCFHRRFFVFLC